MSNVIKAAVIRALVGRVEEVKDNGEARKALFYSRNFAELACFVASYLRTPEGDAVLKEEQRRVRHPKMVEYWGEPCPDHEPGCPACDAWEHFNKYGIVRK